jgi:hypothetical protein
MRCLRAEFIYTYYNSYNDPSALPSHYDRAKIAKRAITPGQFHLAKAPTGPRLDPLSRRLRPAINFLAGFDDLKGSRTYESLRIRNIFV